MEIKAKVLVGPSVMGEGPLDLIRSRGFQVVPNPFGRKYARAELVALLDGVEGILAGLEPLDREVLSRSRLKVISRVGSGMSNVDLSAAASLGIKVYSTPDGPTQAVAEMAVGSLLCLLRKIHVMDRDLHQGKWNKIVGGQLAGKTVAVIGYGRIGATVAGMLRMLGCRILAVDPYCTARPEGVEFTDLAAALRAADVISLHASGDDLLLGPAEFRAMKPGMFLLNAARATLIDEDALADALESGRVAGCWLDVHREEPYHGRLCGMPQCLLTPHTASYTVEGRLRMETEAARNLLAGFGVLEENP